MVDRVRRVGGGDDDEEQGYYRGRQDSHGGSDTLASVMLRPLVCFTFEPITDTMTPRALFHPARLARRPVLSTQSDERLVDLVRAGSDPAFEAIVERYRRALMRYVSRLLPPERAEDVVQQSFVKAYEAMHRNSAELNLKPWLYRIAHNGALNALRDRGAAHAELSDTIDGVERPDQAFERTSGLRELVVAVQALPERQRSAILLREMEGRSYEEIATALGVTDGAVRQLLNRARNTLRAAAASVIPMPLVERLAASASSDPVTGPGGGAGGRRRQRARDEGVRHRARDGSRGGRRGDRAGQRARPTRGTARRRGGGRGRRSRRGVRHERLELDGPAAPRGAGSRGGGDGRPGAAAAVEAAATTTRATATAAGRRSRLGRARRRRRQRAPADDGRASRGGGDERGRRRRPRRAAAGPGAATTAAAAAAAQSRTAAGSRTITAAPAAACQATTRSASPRTRARTRPTRTAAAAATPAPAAGPTTCRDCRAARRLGLPDALPRPD